MNIEIFDDFLTEYQCQSIDNTLSHSSFPWYFNKDLNGVEFVGNFYFFHLFLERRMNNKESQYLPVVLPIIDKLGVPLSKVRRIKANLSTRTQRRYNHQVHYDYQPNSPWISVCYYVNSTNGPTVFDNNRWIKRKVKSKRNRLARFDGSQGHHSTTPTDANYRITINIDYER
tara:strand:- start:17 stop:532 length:516 start_codon:yes stop_codon:yes gene_type:complete